MRHLNAIIISAIIMTAAIPAAAYNVEFGVASDSPVEVQPDKNSGLDAIYVAYDPGLIADIEITGFESGSPVVSVYSNMGGGYAQERPSSFINGVLHIPDPVGDMGYLIADGDKNYRFWLVDYSRHRLVLNSLTSAPEQDCDYTTLHLAGNAAPIYYYGINGQRHELSRELQLDYSNLEFSEETRLYVPTDRQQILNHIGDDGTISVPAVLCDTEFVLSGDRFLRAWCQGISAMSPIVKANGVNCMTFAEQTNTSDDNTDNPSNQIRNESDGLGGSAPAVIAFTACVTDAVIHCEWQMSMDPEFENITYRFNEQDLEYTFTEEGQFYMRFIGSNADGTCETIGDTYTISIGASELRIPNAFSPNDDGVNDVWKVSYRSLVEFNCWIFDRHGSEICHFSDPNQGWDGTRNGKKVKSGVYYYVIEARGADGKRYKKGGDINIVNYRQFGNGSSTAPTE